MRPAPRPASSPYRPVQRWPESAPTQKGKRGRVNKPLIGGKKTPAIPAVDAPSINAESFTST
jgi:hypothetical protein